MTELINQIKKTVVFLGKAVKREEIYLSATFKNW